MILGYRRLFKISVILCALLSAILASAYTITLKDENNQNEVGHATFTWDRTSGHLEELFIEAPYRKFGYGATLFRQAIEYMRKKGCKRITWEAIPFDNEAVDRHALLPKLIAFYTRLGGRLIRYHENNDGADMEYIIKNAKSKKKRVVKKKKKKIKKVKKRVRARVRVAQQAQAPEPVTVQPQPAVEENHELAERLRRQLALVKKRNLLEKYQLQLSEIMDAADRYKLHYLIDTLSREIAYVQEGNA